MRLSIIVLTLLAGITLVTSSVSAGVPDWKFESRGQTEDGSPIVEIGRGLDVGAVVRAFRGMYADATKSADKPEGEELTWGIIQAANPNSTIPVCRIPQDGVMWRGRGDVSVLANCPADQQYMALIAGPSGRIRIPLKRVETVQQKLDRLAKQDACMKDAACLQRKLAVLGVSVRPSEPHAQKTEPPAEMPKGLDKLFGGEEPGANAVLESVNRNLREQIASLRKKPDWMTYFWMAFAAFCGMSALYGGELKKNRKLLDRVAIFRDGLKGQNAAFKAAEKERVDLSLENAALQRRAEELKVAAMALEEKPARAVPPPKPKQAQAASERSLPEPSGVGQSAPRPSARVVKLQAHRAAPTSKKPLLPAKAIDPEVELGKARKEAEAEKARAECLRRDIKELGRKLEEARAAAATEKLRADAEERRADEQYGIARALQRKLDDIMSNTNPIAASA